MFHIDVIKVNTFALHAWELDREVLLFYVPEVQTKSISKLKFQKYFNLIMLLIPCKGICHRQLWLLQLGIAVNVGPYWDFTGLNIVLVKISFGFQTK